MINIVIFSKDRPAQLDACIRSLKKNFKEWNNSQKTIIYTTSAEEYQHGYNILANTYTEFEFVKQSLFQFDTIKALNDAHPYTMFLVDDILFASNFSLNDSVFSLAKNNDQLVSVSLRLHKKLHYCYAIDKSISNPKFLRDIPGEYCVWQWPSAEGDWGYGYSVDGNIYNTQFIKSLLNQIDFGNPNELEAMLNQPRSGIQPIYMCCYEDSPKLFNAPVNRVQGQFQNRHEDSFSAQKLNELFLSGHRIDIEKHQGIQPGAVHWPVDYTLDKVGDE